MTPEERLNQTERFLETAAKYIDRHGKMIEQNQAEMTQLRTSLDETLKIVSELGMYQRQTQDEIKQHRLEIKQHQLEIQRIWEYLLSQSSNGHSSK